MRRCTTGLKTSEARNDLYMSCCTQSTWAVCVRQNIRTAPMPISVILSALVPWPSAPRIAPAQSFFCHARSPLCSRSFDFQLAPLRFPLSSRSAYILLLAFCYCQKIAAKHWIIIFSLKYGIESFGSNLCKTILKCLPYTVWPTYQHSNASFNVLCHTEVIQNQNWQAVNLPTQPTDLEHAGFDLAYIFAVQSWYESAP